MGFPKNIREDVLVACGRQCAICHKFCGTKIEIHHIIKRSEGGEDSFSNAIPLCFDCHSDMLSYDPTHPKGSTYSPAELIRHRDCWYSRVKMSGGPSGVTANNELDKAIYKKIIMILKWDGVIRFIRIHDFGCSFPKNNLDALYNYIYEKHNPSFEFIDSDLEGLRVELLKAIENFCDVIGSKTHSTINPDRMSVPIDWLHRNPEIYYSSVESLNIMAGSIVDIYMKSWSSLPFVNLERLTNNYGTRLF